MKKLTIWQKLIIGNIALTLLLFYWVYSELVYLEFLVRGNLTYSLPQTSIPSTLPNVLVNPITGSFVFVNPVVFPWLVIVAIFILLLIS